jgi:hypothetical protein
MVAVNLSFTRQGNFFAVTQEMMFDLLSCQPEEYLFFFWGEAELFHPKNTFTARAKGRAIGRFVWANRFAEAKKTQRTQRKFFKIYLIIHQSG